MALKDRMETKLITAVCLCLIGSGCAGVQKIVTKPAEASAVLLPTQGSETRGTLRFLQKADLVVVTGKITGISPGPHGLHIHEKGDCSSPDAMSAGGHFNPTLSPHGSPTDFGRHAGDLGNVLADATGVAEFTLEARGLAVGPESHSVVGRSVIVHAGEDDLKSQPGGKSGARLACGLIGKSP